MNQIHVLDRSTIDKIAAGEVVERPASVVKELTENSIDAGATRITIEIRDGGIRLIRITDNGRGISAPDIPLAFLRHATSKITTTDDLLTLSSLGFRGEALSSIAAVSRTEMITKRKEDLTAVRYLIEGGREKMQEEIGAPDGTTIIVRDLFYNTPARAAFLKTPMTEASHVGEYVEQLILSNPDISFTYIVNGQTRISSSGNGSLADAVYHIYGRDVANRLIEIAASMDGIRIGGFIGKPSVSRGNRNFENYYVNGRYVKSRVIMKGIEDGYGTALMQHQYPFTCMSISVEGDKVDVNVHPAKMDVRFSDEKAVYDAVRNAVQDALSGKEMIVESSVNNPEKKEPGKKDHTKAIQAFETAAAKESKPDPAVSEPGDDDAPPAASMELTGNGERPSGIYRDASRRLQEGLREERAEYGADIKIRNEDSGSRAADGTGRFVQQTFSPEFLSHEAKPMRRIVGQIFSTYWICEFDDKVYLFDQHAAHERVLFEKFMNAYEKREISQQQLSPPMLVTLDSRETALLLTYLDAFRELGFEIEHFGENDYAVRAVPYYLGTIDSEKLFRELLDELEAAPSLKDMKLYVHRVATEACKAAVKGGETLSFREAETLLDDLMKCSDPYHCPHGRPTIISFTSKDLEKRFKRIV